MSKDTLNQSERNFNFLESRYFSLIEDLINSNSNNVFLIIQKARKEVFFKDDVYVYFFLNLLSKNKPENYVNIFLKHEIFGLDIHFVNETLHNIFALIDDNEFMKIFQKNTKEKLKDLNDKDITISPAFYRKLNFFLSIDNLSEEELEDIIKKNEIKRKAHALDSTLDIKEDSEIFKI